MEDTMRDLLSKLDSILNENKELDAIKNHPEADDPRIQQAIADKEKEDSVDESGLQYYTGKKKYGKEGMTALAKAGRDGASEEELGRIKDKYKKEEFEVDETSKFSPTDDVVGFTVNSEKAYNVVMRQFGDYIDWDEDEGVMYVPEKMWSKVEMAAFDADGEGATRIEDEQSRNWDKEDIKGYADRSSDADAEEYHKEGYSVTRGIDKEKYQERDGLEGPFSAKNGKVVYYDKKEGKYYDPDSDIYIDHDEWQAMNESGFEIGDAFGISFSEDFEIGAEIVDILEDGVVIELDDTAMDYLMSEGFTFEDGEIVEGKQHGNSKIYDKCWKGYRKVPGKARGEPGSCKKIGEELEEAEYQGRKVPLGKPMAGDVKKSKVYVKNPKGNVVKVNFGDKKMKIKKSNPNRRKSFRARHNCENPGPRHKARYWSCRAW
jgi:hypothetical protein